MLALEDNSYGYDNVREALPTGPVIDLRRPPAQAAAPTAPVEIVPQAAPVVEAQAAQSGARPPWLEQERVGPPYEVGGRWFVPTPEPGYEMTGTASWYGPTFHGQATSSGEIFDQEGITAAHPTLPIPSLVQVTNLATGREIVVRVNDRGPYVGDRVIDLSRGAARVLGFDQAGTAQVHVRYLGPAPRLVTASGASAPVAAAPAEARPFASGPTDLTPPAMSAPAPVQSAQAAAPTGAYVVQVGAYSDLANAQRVRTAVESAGPVNVDARQTARGEIYRVRVGPFASSADAEAARAAIARLGYGDSVVAAR
jgi:rare lipoprotein A